LVRFALTFIARFTFLTFLINLFSGKERKGIRNFVPWFTKRIRLSKLGVSILLFDIVWEILIVLWRSLVLVARSLFPIIMRIVPNVIGSFITKKVIPFFANVIPIIRDDVKVMYIRSNVRERIRKFKKNVLMLGRRSRPKIRPKISPLLPSYVREKKNTILEKTTASQASDEETG